MAKATKKQALGRGLSALLNDPENDIKSVSDKNADQVIGNVVELDINSIEVNPFQPRSNFNDETLEELASSIRELGIIQPITVRKLDFNKFQLVSGERRFRASKLVGLETIPAYIRIANDQESLEMALVENIQRQDLDPIEIALSYQRLIDEIEITQEKLSDRVGKKRSTITNYLNVLNLYLGVFSIQYIQIGHKTIRSFFSLWKYGHNFQFSGMLIVPDVEQHLIKCRNVIFFSEIHKFLIIDLVDYPVDSFVRSDKKTIDGV